MMAKNAVATMTKWMGMSTKLGTISTAATMMYDNRNTSSIVVRLVVEGYAWPLLPGNQAARSPSVAVPAESSAAGAGGTFSFFSAAVRCGDWLDRSIRSRASPQRSGGKVW